MVVFLLVAVAVTSFGWQAVAASWGAFPVKVMVFTMFRNETAPWLSAEPIVRPFPVDGAFSAVWCTDGGLCVTTTGIGKANAASSVTAILRAPQLDFSQAVFLTAGIAGTPPDVGTLGAAAWADWVVDWDLGHHLLPEPGAPSAELFVPLRVETGYEKFRLNGDLVSLAVEVTKDVPLVDSEQARNYRARYPGQEGRRPEVLRCDTITGDDYWHGTELSRLAAQIVRDRTAGAGRYCTTQMEDSAVALVLARFGYLDRYVNLRTMSNFDQPHPGQSTIESLRASSGGFPLAVQNAYRVGSAFARYVLARPEAVWKAVLTR